MTSYPIPPNCADRVLVASPSNVVRQRVLESLRSPQRRFEQAAGGAEALLHLESGGWQMLFLDRRLPDLDAEELSQTVRQRFPGVEVVLLDPEPDGKSATAWTAFEDPSEALTTPSLRVTEENERLEEKGAALL
jgi:CheY-like chemotaxis protein